MYRAFMALVLSAVLLSGCGTLEIYVETTPVGESILPGSVATVEPKLSLDSTSEEIRLAMLESASKWKSIWMDGTVTYYTMEGADSQTTTAREQVWIDLTMNRFRVLSGPADGAAEQFLTSDGTTILKMDLATGQSESHLMNESSQVGQYVPTLQPGYAYPQPLWGAMGTPLSQLAFTSDFAQADGTFKPIATEMIAGREALVIEWTQAQSELPSSRMWLDGSTAVILKMQTFDKGGSDTIRSETVVSRVSFEDVFANSLFGIPASLPQFSDVTGNPLNASEPAPAASSDHDPLQEVYFFVFDHNYGNEKTQLVRVPGSCVAGLSACPEAEVISTPFDLKFSLTSLIWSPNGDATAFAYPVSTDGNKASLFLFNPQEQTWDSLVEFNCIDPPMWSPDGMWLAFRVQDGEGRDEIHIIRRDGTELTNLSANEKLPSAGQPYVLNGWINNNVILRGRNNRVYLLRADDGTVRPLFDTPWEKSNFVPSPDGYFLAYVDISDQRAVLKLLTPDGNTSRDLTTFQNASIYPLVWSPDGTYLAFAKATNDPNIGQDVYMIGSDGRNLQQVYHSNSSSIADITFSPDGKYLLLQDDDATGRHIFIVDLSTLEQHMIQVPDLPLDRWWLAPSWRPQ
ncbi:MAG: hypothetical protein ABI621_06585 [Chloroflexota bacterium]